MKYRTYIRVFLLSLITCISLILFSYSHSSSGQNNQDKDECGKCNHKKAAHTEFILWESLSRNFLSLSH